MINALLALIFYAAVWMMFIVRYIGDYLANDLQVNSWTQIIFNLKLGQENSSTDVWITAIQGFFDKYGSLLTTVGFFVFIFMVWSIYTSIKKHKLKKKKQTVNSRTFYIPCVLLLVGCITMIGVNESQIYGTLEQLGYYKYLKQQSEDSNFFERYYEDSSEVVINFDGQKKNLIYIFLESMETSYSDKENGGGYKTNYIPALTDLVYENNDFGDGEVLNGAYATMNTTWTAGALVGTTSGVPLIYADSHAEGTNDDYWDKSDEFLPGLTSIGEILEDNGYKNYFMCGSDGAFAGRENYFTQHGNYEILDYDWANDSNLLPYKDYYVWWGFEDKYLFEFAKDELKKIAKSDEPFNFTMLTVDTHFTDGYPCSLCKNKYPEQMKNVIACSDSQVVKFVKWIQKQDWYEDTVIVISGDHCSMDPILGTQLEDFDRKVYTCILNGPEYDGEPRTYSTLDLFPTTLAAIGAEIGGERLGLGTNLYSERQTLIEELGLETVNEEIPKNSSFYLQTILGYSQDEIDQGHVFWEHWAEVNY